jgi:hypothetical protein
MLLWGSWLLVTGAVLSYAQGIIHPYYTVALAPAIGALVGIGAVTLWQLRSGLLARAVLSAGLAGTAVWAFVLLDRAPGWQPWLRLIVLITGLVCAVMLAAPASARSRVGLVVVAAGVALGLAAPAAYALDTAATPHHGAIPSAGPPSAELQGGGFGGGGPGGFPGRRFSSHRVPGHGLRSNGFAGPGNPTGGRPPLGGFAGGFRDGRSGGSAGLGGLLGDTTSNTALDALLARDANRYTWVAAAVGSNMAAGFQLATGYPVMPVGGFNGSDPSPTLTRFQGYVAQGAIHYFIGNGGFPGQHGGSSSSRQIADWVQQNFTATTVGGATVYDLAVR